MADERRGDWEHGVDENLVSLNAAQRVTDKEVDDHDIAIGKLEQVVFGDPTENLDGLGEQVHAMQKEVTRLRRVLDPDFEGKHGIVKDVAYLLDRDSHKKAREDRAVLREGWAWASITKIVVELLIVTALLLLNWERVEDFFKSRFHVKPDKVEQMIEDAKRPRHRRHKPKPIILPEAQDEPASEEMH